jgi:KEOPS complex subunit Cgi121
MEMLPGRATVEDLDGFVERLGAIGEDHGATVQAFDARYVVDREHLANAVELADRAIDRGEAIADDRAMEILCYAAGTRQIRDALEIGVAHGEAQPVVVLADGGDETACLDHVRPMLSTAGAESDVTVGAYDESLVRAYYDVGDAELGATDAGIPDLVRERVALLVVER